MSYHPGKFNWFEHLSSDPAQAVEFYRALLGWTARGMTVGQQPYRVIHNGAQAIGGFRETMPGLRCQWNAYLSVADVDASWRDAIAAGANAVLPPAHFGGIGRAAMLADPTGALLSLWHGAQPDRPDVDDIAKGDWYWNELSATDAKAALAFYERVFRYRHELMQSPSGDYYILHGPDGKARGGVMQSAHAQAPSAWVPYVRVEDADAIAARVGPLGGKLMMAPLDIAGIGRIGALFDPQGAPLGFIQPAVKA
jgi:predicted enzyme related to lactoylglutathione lyase